MPQAATTWTRIGRCRLSRRAVLGAAARAAIGGSAIALVGCGGDDGERESPADFADAIAEQPTARAGTSAPQRRGTLRLHAALTELDFFDVHRSRFATTQLFAALQQNRLLRFAGGSGDLVPDLAALPELPDPQTAVFTVRGDVRWWDRAPTNGRPFTTDDIRANVERQAAGLDAAGTPDPLFLRQAGYAQATLQVIDRETAVFRTDAPRGAYLGSVHAGPWAFYQAPEIWESFGDRLRDDPFDPDYYSGTGPFQVDTETFQPGERITFRSNPGYFRSERPWLDSLTLRHLVDPGDLLDAYAAADLDLWTPADPRDVDTVEDRFPDHTVFARPLPFGIHLAINYRSPDGRGGLRDPRLAQAVHLALDRRAILTHAYGPHAFLSGPAPWFLPAWAPAQDDLHSFPGYGTGFSAVAAQVRDLVDAVNPSQSMDFALPDVFEATHPGLGALVQRMLADRLGIGVSLSIRTLSQIREGMLDGSVDAFLGWSDPITDPDLTESLYATMHSSGAANLGGFAEPGIDAALERMRTALTAAERQQIFQSSVEPALRNAPSWSLVIGHGLQRGLHPPSLHLPRFSFGWDGHRFEDAWRSS